MKTKVMKRQARQGDILFVKISPKEIRGKQTDDPVIAHGEMTGHAHMMVGGTHYVDGSTHYMGPTTMVHDEHDPIEIPVPTKVIRQRQLDLTTLTPIQVAD